MVFKPVQIKKEHRNADLVSIRLAHRLVEAIAKQETIGQAGERIVVGQAVEMRLALPELFFDAQPVGDVACHLDHPVEVALAIEQR